MSRDFSRYQEGVVVEFQGQLCYSTGTINKGSQCRMERIFQRIVDSNFAELKGTTVQASILVPESLINELVEVALSGDQSITSAPVSVHPQNRISIDLKTKLLPWALNLKLKLDDSVDFASYSSPKLRAWLENHRWLGSLGSILNVLPEGIKLYGNQAVIDLAAFLKMPEQRRLLDLVKSVDIRTEEGTVILDAKLGVG